MKFARKNEYGIFDVREVADGPAATAQAEVYESLGFSAVEESEKPDDTAYVIWSPFYEEMESGAVREVYRQTPRVIRLDRDKAIDAIVRRGMLEEAKAVFAGNEEAKRWWADSMVYVEGSEMAGAFMRAFGLSLDQIHSIVEEARA